MSGGFFRGTSTDQDTRFSNKQAKLLKSQKFPPELDNLVDMTKVKMDVLRPWIATRVTELLGFEDEVLINFIYGLLDGKDINGKEVQIQLTGFMEKNTGKFMKELWCLLLSAQKNASGVPQQFLDAKEEEIRKKKEESDRITLEIQKKRDLEQEKPKKMDGEVDTRRSRSPSSKFDPISKHLPPKAPGAHKQVEGDDARGKNRLSRSPLAADRARSSERGRNESRSISGSPRRRNSFSPKRQYRSPRKRSMSPRRRHSPRRARTPSRRGSPRSRRRSTSRSRRRSSVGRRSSPSLVRHRSPSPIRRRSPLVRRRSPSPSRHRSPSPLRRGSSPPIRRRSPSSLRRGSQSPVRRRSPSPMRQISPPPRHRRSLSPIQRRYRRGSPTPRRRSPSPLRRLSPSPPRRRSPSPLRRRSPSPLRRISPSPPRRRSPSPTRRRSPSPLRRISPSPPRRRSPLPTRRRSPSPPHRRSPSPMRRRLPPPRSPRQRRRSPMRSPRQRNRSRSPYRSQSPVYRSRRSLSVDDSIQTNGVASKRNNDDYASQSIRGKRSPVRMTPEREEVELANEDHPMSHQPPISLRSPQREPRNRSVGRKNVLTPSPPEKSVSRSGSSPDTRKVIHRGDKRISGSSESPVRVTREQIARSGTAVISPSTMRQRRDSSRRRENSGSSGEEEDSNARGDKAHRAFSPRKRTKHSPTIQENVVPPPSFNDEEHSTRILARDLPDDRRAHHMDHFDLRKKDREHKSEKAFVRVEHPQISTQNVSHGPGRIEGERSLDHVLDERSLGKKRSGSRNFEGSAPDEKHAAAALPKSVKRVEGNDRVTPSDSESDDNDKYRSGEMEKRKHRRGGKHSDDDSHDSQVDDKKEAKRKRKEEKRLRKEEKRRRREERHRRREERRAGKVKAKYVDTVAPPPDMEKNQNDVGRRKNMESDASDVEITETEQQKRLEIELRKKALESLRAKKAVNL